MGKEQCNPRLSLYCFILFCPFSPNSKTVGQILSIIFTCSQNDFLDITKLLYAGTNFILAELLYTELQSSKQTLEKYLNNFFFLEIDRLHLNSI